jgi:hypothetical protein
MWFLRVSFANTSENQKVSENKNVQHPLHYAQAYKLQIQAEESSGP